MLGYKTIHAWGQVYCKGRVEEMQQVGGHLGLRLIQSQLPV